MSHRDYNTSRHQRLTSRERSFLDLLPGPPRMAAAHVGGVLILEWLQDNPSERRTGLELDQFLQGLRPNWSTYIRCRSKAELLEAIHRAASPKGWILHIECHGCEDGLGDGSDQDFLTWDELNASLQTLNLASNCNLIVFIAACLGFAAINALAAGPRAPAVALVGPADSLSPAEVLQGAKAFYQTLIEGTPHLQSMTSSSTQSSNVHFEPEPMATLAFEAWTERMLIAARPESRQQRIEGARDRLMKEFGFTSEECEARLAAFDRHEAQATQLAWDYFFMLDRRPDNAARFGVDFNDIAQRIEAFHNQTS